MARPHIDLQGLLCLREVMIVSLHDWNSYMLNNIHRRVLILEHVYGTNNVQVWHTL